MKARDDVDFITKAVDGKWITEKQAKTFLNLPLVMIPRVERDNVQMVHMHTYAGRTLEHIVLYSKHLLKEYVAMIADRYIYIKSDGRTLSEFGIIVGEIGNMVSWKITMVSFDKREFTLSEPITTHELPKWTKDHQPFKKYIFEWAVMMLKGLLGWIEYQNLKRLYAIGIKPVGCDVDLAKTKEYARKTGHKVIFLDELPKPRLEKDDTITILGKDKENINEELKPVPKMGHPKRGHYRVLRDPIYCNHPMYKDPKGIFIKACWVGPKETVYKGNVYTVLE